MEVFKFPKRGLISDLGVVFWKFSFGAFQSRKKTVKYVVFGFFYLYFFLLWKCWLNMHLSPHT